jgi:hypothetical protein
MIRGWAVGLATVASMAAASARAQGLISASGASLSIATPGETQYDAGASGASGNYTITTSCIGTGSAGCRLFLQYGSNPQGLQLDMEYAVVSLGSADCAGAVANANAWLTVQPTSVVLSTAKNRVCVATFRFRVSPLSYAVHVSSPGPPGGTYMQNVIFVFTRP